MQGFGLYIMVNMPEHMRGEERRKVTSSGSPPPAPTAVARDGMNSRGGSSGDSSGFDSPNGGEEMSQTSLLPNNHNSSKHNWKHSGASQGVMVKPQPKQRPPLSNMMGCGYPATARLVERCSIEDEKAYTNIPLSPLSPASAAAESLLNDSLASAGSRMVTMTGTIRRGQKPVQVQLQLTDKEMKTLNRASVIEQDKAGDCMWGARKGLHIVVLSLMYAPFALLTSLAVCLYVGTVCWYNMYLYLSEESTIWHKIFLCPLLILLYPALVALVPLTIALVAAVKQISWYFSSWYREIKDFDKGFFGWLCSKLDVPQCAPYEVVIIDEQQMSPEATEEEQTAV